LPTTDLVSRYIFALMPTRPHWLLRR
jgi:hypothetical protein